LEHDVARIERRERGQADLFDQVVHAILTWTDPLAAELDRPPENRPVLGAAADPVSGFEHDDRCARRGQHPRCGQAGEAGAGDEDICVPHSIRPCTEADRCRRRWHEGVVLVPVLETLLISKGNTARVRPAVPVRRRAAPPTWPRCPILDR
jgi:hypothetical protein